MTSVLAISGSRLAAASAGAGTSGNRPTRPPRAREDPAHHGVRDRIAAPWTGRRRREDRADDAPPAVDHRAAGVARAHHPAQRDELPLDRPAAVGVLRHGRPPAPHPPPPPVVGPV